MTALHIMRLHITPYHEAPYNCSPYYEAIYNCFQNATETHLQQIGQAQARSLAVSPQPAADLAQQLPGDRVPMRLHSRARLGHQRPPDGGHRLPHPWVGVVLVPDERCMHVVKHRTRIE